MRAKHDSLAILLVRFQLFVEHKVLERCGRCNTCSLTTNTVLTHACNLFMNQSIPNSKIAPSSVASPVFFYIHTYKHTPIHTYIHTLLTLFKG